MKLPASPTTTTAGPPSSRRVPNFPDTFGLGIAEGRASEFLSCPPVESEPSHAALFTCPSSRMLGDHCEPRGGSAGLEPGNANPTSSGLNRGFFFSCHSKTRAARTDFVLERVMGIYTAEIVPQLSRARG